jgi:hypothetical protein
MSIPFVLRNTFPARIATWKNNHGDNLLAPELMTLERFLSMARIELVAAM